MDLVVGASESTINSLVGKLGSLLAQEYALIRGVRGDIQYINDELASMKAFLLDLTQDDHDNRKKDWMKQIRDMAYDCEDCIDDFAHRLPKDSNFSGKCCCPWLAALLYDLWTCWPRHEIASNIAELKVRAQLIADRRMRYGVENPRSRESNDSSDDVPGYDEIAEDQLPRREMTMKEPVGTRTVMEELEKWVENKAVKDRTVASIVGFGGVGKTTIAMALFNKVMKDFDCRAWVTVSQNYDEEAVFRDILSQIIPDYNQQDSYENSERRNTEKCIPGQFKRALQLCRGHTPTQHDNSGRSKLTSATTVKEHLQEKRYIILVDDIWSAETWKQISRCLPDNNRSSRIIVTSRLRSVGAACYQSEKDHIFSIDFLCDEDAEMLFKQSVSESKCRNDGDANNLSKQNQKHSDKEIIHHGELWRRCGGQPLAIVTMAGLVACNQNKPTKYWDKLCKRLPARETSVTEVFDKQVNSLTLEGVKRILDCCYNDLHGDLKTCLLYLAMFPKGCKTSRKCVTRRWIAEGFVTKKYGLTEEELAETYFNQLLRRKLIRPVDHSSNGKLKTFQVHDMVLDYIASKAREENFITVIGGHWMMPAPSGKVRRLSMQSSSSKPGDSTKGFNLSQVRSLTAFGNINQLRFQEFNNRLIQVLDFQGLKGVRDKHMNHICKMLILKYLSLRGTAITEIPPRIGKLEFLETLDIRETDVEELPENVRKLKRITSILGGSKNKNPRKGLRLPEEKRKKQQLQDKEDDGMKALRLQDNEGNGMKALRILSGIEINKTTAVESFYLLTELKKLSIYKLSIEGPDKIQIFEQLLSSIEYLCSCGLQTLAINDLDSEFIESLDKMSAAPRYLVALELSGKLEETPNWLQKLHTLNKLTLSVTVLRTGTLDLLSSMPLLYSLTFSFSGAKQDNDIVNVLEKNKSQSDGEIFVPKGFKSLKLLRFFAPRVPKLGFCDNAMPALEIIEMRYQTFEGLFGVNTLGNLKGVHLREEKLGEKDEKTINGFLLDDLKYSTEELQVAIDHTFITY